MTIDLINNSGATGTVRTTSTPSSSSGSSTLTMDDFFSLMVAQLSNQDMYNTMDDTQFIAQMAQFSMVQALSDLSKASATSYGVSLMGKEVTIAESNADGTLSSFAGIVEGVTLYNGSAEIVVDGTAYPLSRVMIVKEPNIIIPDSSIKASQDSQPVSDSEDSTDKIEGDSDV